MDTDRWDDPPARPAPPLLRPYVDAVSDAPTPDPTPLPVRPAEPSGLRPYLLTSGRAQSAYPELELEAQIGTTEAGRAAVDQLAYEHRDIVVLCQQPLALAELTARLGLHLGVVRVLVGDLIQSGHLSSSRPRAGVQSDIQIMERVIRGLESIR